MVGLLHGHLAEVVVADKVGVQCLDFAIGDLAQSAADDRGAILDLERVDAFHHCGCSRRLAGALLACEQQEGSLGVGDEHVG